MPIPRVLIISHMYPSAADPVTGIFIHRAVQALRDTDNVECKVVSPVPWAPRIIRGRLRRRKWAEIQQSKRFEGIPTCRPAVFEVPHPFFWPYRGLSMAIRLVPVLAAIRKRFPFNIIHSHTVTPDGLAGMLLGTWFKTPTVCTIRGSDINSYPFRSRRYYDFSRRVLTGTNVILANNRTILDKARRIASKEIDARCIYNGVDRSLFFPEADKRNLRLQLNLPVDQVLLIFIGNCIKSKGLPELSEAFLGLAMKHTNSHLIVVGDGPLRAPFEAESVDAGLRDRLTFTGRIDQRRTAEYMRAADIFVLPSHEEGMPNALLEAMACGVAPIVTPVGGVIEILKDGANGILVSLERPDRLVDAMANLSSNREFMRNIAITARTHAHSMFSWDTHAHETVAIYRSLLNSSNAGNTSPNCRMIVS
jgi:teichuronic acid biosynthesis glycosyltransferase TuaC